MKRRIEIVAFETERVIERSVITKCPVCLSPTELLTTNQAVALARVELDSIYRWLDEGKMHGAKTPDGDYRLCRNSLLTVTES
jgi:hypothetical protein